MATTRTQRIPSVPTTTGTLLKTRQRSPPMLSRRLKQSGPSRLMSLIMARLPAVRNLPLKSQTQVGARVAHRNSSKGLREEITPRAVVDHLTEVVAATIRAVAAIGKATIVRNTSRDLLARTSEIDTATITTDLRITMARLKITIAMAKEVHVTNSMSSVAVHLAAVLKCAAITRRLTNVVIKIAITQSIAHQPTTTTEVVSTTRETNTVRAHLVIKDTSPVTRIVTSAGVTKINSSVDTTAHLPSVEVTTSAP